MRKTTKTTLTALAVADLAFGAGAMAGADSPGIRITEQHSNWQSRRCSVGLYAVVR